MSDIPRLTTPDQDVDLDREIVRIPKHCREGLLDYLRHGIMPGTFLRAVLENNLWKAVIHADDTNRGALVEYVLLLNYYAPSDAWGSPIAVKEWIAKGVAARTERELTADEAAQALGTFVAGKGGAQ